MNEITILQSKSFLSILALNDEGKMIYPFFISVILLFCTNDFDGGDSVVFPQVSYFRNPNHKQWESKKTIISVRIAKAITKSLNAKTTQNKTLAYHNLFKQISASDLSALTRHQALEVSLFASWELTRRFKHNGKYYQHPERIIGYFEGKTGINIPDEFAAFIVTELSSLSKLPAHSNLQVYHNKGVVDLAYEEQIPVVDYTLAPSNYHAKLQINLQNDTNIDNEIIRVGNKITRLTNNLKTLIANYGNKYRKRGYCNIEITDGCAVVALYYIDSRSWNLYCFDRRKGGLLWKTKTWSASGTTRINPLKDVYYHIVRLKHLNNSLYVFGYCDRRIYIEAYDLRTGEYFCRFNSI